MEPPLPAKEKQAFSEELKYLMINAFKDYLEDNNLQDQQKLGIITYILKSGKDRSYIKNGRPIALLNTTYKIFSGLLANQLKNIRTYNTRRPKMFCK